MPSASSSRRRCVSIFSVIRGNVSAKRRRLRRTDARQLAQAFAGKIIGLSIYFLRIRSMSETPPDARGAVATR
jgi:hypothetical protein